MMQWDAKLIDYTYGKWECVVGSMGGFGPLSGVSLSQSFKDNLFTFWILASSDESQGLPLDYF